MGQLGRESDTLRRIRRGPESFLSAYEDGLTAGSNTFRLKYRTSGSTAHYQNRRLVVIPYFP